MLAKVRNPWNQEMYTGPWRDDDPNWTESRKREVNLTNSNDGIFWMEYDTFLSYFYSSSVAMYEDYAVYHQKEILMEKRTLMIEFENPVAQELYIVGEMNSRRHYPRADMCNPQNSVALFLIDNNYQYVGDHSSAHVGGYTGFGTVGSLGTPIPAGKFIIYMY